MNASLENFRRLSDGKDKNAWAQPPEPLTQAVGDSFSVVVTYLQSPTEIIVQKVENAGKRPLLCTKNIKLWLLTCVFLTSVLLVYRGDSEVAVGAA